MIANEFLLAVEARQRIAEARAAAERLALGDALRPPRRPVRVAVGEALVRLGARLVERAAAPAPRAATRVVRGRIG